MKARPDPSKMSLAELADASYGWEDIWVIMEERRRKGPGRPSRSNPGLPANITKEDVRAYVLYRRQQKSTS